MREGPVHLCHCRRGFLERPKYDTRTYFHHWYYDISAYKTKPGSQPCSFKTSDIMIFKAIVQQVLFQTSIGQSMTIRARSSRKHLPDTAQYNYSPSFTYLLPIFRPYSLKSKDDLKFVALWELFYVLILEKRETNSCLDYSLHDFAVASASEIGSAANSK